MDWSIDEIIELLQARDECDHIEAKEAKTALGKSALESISAFSNEPDLGGGYLILGLKQNDTRNGERYLIQGVKDPDKVQQELVRACRNDFNIRISPKINVTVINDCTVIWAFIPESSPRSKPVYIESIGIQKGTFRRIGSSDQHCSAEDLDLLYQLRAGTHFESEIIKGVSWNDISLEAVESYRRQRKAIDPNAEELQLDDQELLLSLKTAVKDSGEIIPTIGGLLLFGTKAALKRELPMASRIDYLIVEGTEWVSDPSQRYESVIEYREALVPLMPRLHSQLMSDIPSKFGLKTGALQRSDTPLYPRDVIREATANTLMHRDYRSHQPTLIIRYSNRLEFRNAGYSLKPIEEIGQPGSKPRNPIIADVFHELKHAETKGTGIRSMRKWMKEAGLTTPPILESKREGNEFDLILLPHHLLDHETMEWLSQFRDVNLSDSQRNALAFTQKVGAITNLDYRQLNGGDTLSASSALRGLRDARLLEQKGRGNNTYYTLSSRALETSASQTSIQDKEPAQGISLGDKALAQGISLGDKGLSAIPKNFPLLPEKLKKDILELGKRAKTAKIKEIIKELCTLSPLSNSELAQILDRSSEHLRKEYLSKMIQSGDLAYFHEDPEHPQQAYTVPKKDDK